MGNVLSFYAVTLCLMGLISSQSHANAVEWSAFISPSFLTGVYSGDTTKESLSTVGFHAGAEHLDQHRFSVGYQTTKTQFQLEDDSTLNLSQDTLQLETSISFFIDSIQGELMPGIQYQTISGNLSDQELGDVSIQGVLLRYLAFAKNLYFDIHFSKSNYDAGVSVKQYDLATGMSFFSPRNWLQMRLYLIGKTNISDDYRSLELNFKRWINAKSAFSPNALFISSFKGNRFLAVDPETQSVWNLMNEHTHSIKLGLDWILPNNAQISTLFGYNKYQLLDGDESHKNGIFYINCTKAW